MTIFSAVTEEFLSDGTREMSRELVEAVIENYGGEDQFIQNYGYVTDGKINGGINGFISTFEMTEFFKNNKAAIIGFAKDTYSEFGYESLCGMISNFGILGNDYTVEEVAEGLFDSESENHDTMATALVLFVGEEVARYYSEFIEDKEEAQ